MHRSMDSPIRESENRLPESVRTSTMTLYDRESRGIQS